jgi:predicted transposase/invertase (TIGR01784 family)
MADFRVLEGFLSELLEEDIKIDGLLESESNMQDAGNKMTRFDLRAKDSKGELLIIEVQSAYKHDYLLRILFGVAKLIVDNTVSGADYHTVKKVISINIVYFDLGQGNDYVYRGTTKFMGIHNNDILNLSQQEKLIFKAEQIERVYPEFYIIKVENFESVAKNTLDEWIYFLKTEEVKKGTKPKGLQAAKEQIDQMRLDKQAMAEYERDGALLHD